MPPGFARLDLRRARHVSSADVLEGAAQQMLVITAVATAAFAVERTRVGRQIGASLLAIGGGALIGNLGWLPGNGPVTDAISGPVTSLAIVWLLLAVDLEALKAAGPRMLAAFAVAVLATLVGVVAGSAVFAPVFGEDIWRLAGVLTGTYTGGSLNFVAVGREVALPPEIYLAATAADNIVTALWLAACIVVPWLAGGRRGRGPSPAEGRLSARFDALGLAVPIGVGLAVLVCSEALARWLPSLPEILISTTLALLVARLPWLGDRERPMLLGHVALHLFFVVIGIQCRIDRIVEVGPAVLWLTAVVVGVHGLVVFGIGRLLELEYGILTVASVAAIGGPSTALAVAVAKGWRRLVLPGLAVGLLGYAIGTYLGLIVAALVRATVAGA